MRKFAPYPSIRWPALLIAAVLAAQCAPPTPLPRGDGPSLIVMIVLDQARQDYLERFRPLYAGGLAYLLDNGVVFSAAHHEHSMTATAPGHATLSTGMEPARSGIVGNNWYDRQRRVPVYSAGLSSFASPVNLEVTALGDWLKRADSRSKVFAASAKDRSAVMMGGQQPDAAYWYDRDSGQWISSGYYRGADREWLEAFHEQRLLDEHFGTVWKPLASDHPLPAGEGVQLDRGAFEWSFPYSTGGYTPTIEPSFYSAIYSTPFMDEYLMRFAKALIANEELGADGSVDFLGLGFSALDAIGHSYGPNSPEIVDELRRLDLYLQELLDFLDAEIGLEHVVIALSSDHGVVPLPEYRALTGETGRRLGAADVACVQRAGRQLGEQLGADDLLLRGFYLNDEAIERLGLTRPEVEEALATLVMRCAAVARVWTATELQSYRGDTDEITIRHRNNYYPGRSPDLIIQLHAYDLYHPGTGTTHGSAYEYDSHVPLIIAAPGVRPAVIDSRVATADLAPTLARMVGIEPPGGLDGTDLSELLSGAGDRR